MSKIKRKEKVLRSRRESAPKLDISQETRNSIWGIASFILAVLSVLSFAGKAGTAGAIFDAFARSLFGWGFFIVPIAFLLFGVAFLKSISRKIYLSAVLGTVLFVLSVLSVFYIFGHGDFDTRLLQGGYLGVILGLPLLNLVGFYASMVILLALLFISLLVTLDVPIYRLINRREDEGEKLTDNVVVRRGSEVINPDKKPELKPIITPKATVTKIAELTDKEFVIKSMKLGKWSLPPLELLHADQDEPATGDINASAQIIRKTLANFSIDVEMGEVSIGPTVTRFTLRPALGVKLSRITALNSDLALALAAHPIRIEAPIPGQSLVGIEVPNKKVAIVGLRDMFNSDEYLRSKSFMPLAVGRDVGGTSIYAGLDKMPHLLIAGATGSGKSVCINTVLLSLLYKHSPEILKLILVDPKRVELSLYNGIPHLITPVITENKKVLGALKWAVNEMDRRYDTLSRTASRDIYSYNVKMSERKEPIMPFIVIVIDELADLMVSYGRDVEAAIVRLAQMARAVGIHLVVSTQRPSVDVITGLIKANITTRVAFQVASLIDSRTILDTSGAEKLLGRGDMLFQSAESKMKRLQCALVTEKEVKDVAKFLKMQAEELELTAEDENNLSADFEAKVGESGGFSAGTSNDDADDPMYEEAKAVVVSAQKGSASLLQRRLRVGYARAARLLDILEEKGIIGPGDGAKPRDVYIKQDGANNVDAILTSNVPDSENNESGSI
ncbi:MAG: hypothetical protein A3C81_03030 [Candidatus Yanofskybacteria bacterium RIFCSPHIGHO2_02_FULL_46_19]|uniref:FtsK domain-containing protein n=2 Tax=Candidatus Yanofskyibacteriota TaxID=1752733 RepID=A0A1F8H4N1_9BACT|nr:MAG: hypothetical protein A3C81_03030 [Candidatus Yanofskybacteria bacterium RIFCSPHIGHO2_02_FULL_46_19]OGN31948.1 MAG: hypothetical protein A3J01_03020 [Candidatus Yanofskybacteria bacterium RIFCSPLOWO2_02_FULL_45_18]